MGNDSDPGAPAPTATIGETEHAEDPMDWSWPPYAPLEPAGGRRFDCADWAPSSIVRRPLVRVGRWTLLYRRGH
ncbi:MAG: hypothetical protein JWQ53_1846 [Klenkia sp.]|nr:hypothetical protein [Klenkia sp.]